MAGRVRGYIVTDKQEAHHRQLPCSGSEAWVQWAAELGLCANDCGESWIPVCSTSRKDALEIGRRWWNSAKPAPGSLHQRVKNVHDYLGVPYV